MFNIAVRLKGGAEAVEVLDAFRHRLAESPREPLTAIGARWAEIFRENITNGRVEWPPRSPVSERLRPGSLMNVGGELLSGITSEMVTDNRVSAGSPFSPSVAALAFGSGQSNRSAFPGARVPARPWAVLDVEQFDASVTTLADWYMEPVS